MLAAILHKAAKSCGNHCCEDAVDLLETALRLRPADGELHYRLGICYSGGCRRHSLTDPDVALEYLRGALKLSAGNGGFPDSASILETLGNVYVYCRHLPKAARLEAAIECHRTAASLYKSSEAPDDWARTEYNQANAWSKLPESEFPEKWREAITHYERALQVRTRERDPKRYAATLQNLGTAYRQLRSGDKAANVLRANDCYRRALEVFTATEFPVQNAAVHNNFGNSYLSLPFADENTGRRYAFEALRHLNRALRFRTRDDFPTDYAITQYNRGHAFLVISAGDLGDSLDKALLCFREAYDCFTMCGRNRAAKMAQKQLKQIKTLTAQ